MKISLIKDLDDSSNLSNFFGNFNFVPCHVDNVPINFSDSSSPEDPEDDDIPEDFTFIPGPRF